VSGSDSSTKGEPRATASSEFEIVNELGLHARAAVKLTQVAQKYPCEVVVANKEQTANAKSVMGVLLLCGGKGTRVVVTATGEGAEQAVVAIGELIANKFGEGK